VCCCGILEVSITLPAQICLAGSLRGILIRISPAEVVRPYRADRLPLIDVRHLSFGHLAMCPLFD